jgi:hypothetical protein
MARDPFQTFGRHARESALAGTLIRLTLSGYRGKEKDLKKIQARLVKTNKGTRLLFTYKFDKKDVTKNHPVEEGIEELVLLAGNDFLFANLFTTTRDYQLESGKRGVRLTESKPSFEQTPDLKHDREKNRPVDPAALYLRELGVTNSSGSVRSDKQDKWRQINRFIETLFDVIAKSRLADVDSINVTDMGSGLGYLTFATYDALSENRGMNVTMIGVESRAELVEKCNSIAAACAMEGLSFVKGEIADTEIPETDILLALHACDTATDDAIFKGILAGAEVILASPCCHKELRKQIKSPELLKPIFKHGTLAEREAESLTDAIRAMILEKAGYTARIFEFIGSEHTPKNNMIVAVRKSGAVSQGVDLKEIDALLEAFSIENQRLRDLVKATSGPAPA